MFRCALACLLSVATAGSAAPAADRPNVVLILADDLGFSDLGCYGGEIRTPNLDRLAAGGLRFTQFYNCARCCPTRAALMTGLYPHQAGVGHMTFDRGTPGYRGRLTENTVTIAEVLRDAGYRTLMAGKWHLSVTQDGPRNALWVSHRLELGRFSDPATYPVGRGFDEHFGTIWGVVDYYDPFSLVRGSEPAPAVPDGFYYTDALTDEAVRMVGSAAPAAKAGDAPFFLYLAYTAPHWPLHAPEEEIARYAGVYDGGWPAVRQARYARMTALGLFDPETAALPDPAPGPPWTDERHAAWEARAMATHAAMVARMDAGIGRVVAELERMGVAEDTLVLFLSDNGASPERIGAPGFDRPSHTPRRTASRLPAAERPRPADRPRDDVRRHRPALGERGQRPVPVLEGDDLRGRTLHALHRVPAGDGAGRRHVADGPRRRRDGDLPRSGGRDLPGRTRRAGDHADGRTQLAGGPRRRRAAGARVPVLGTRRSPGRAEGAVEARRLAERGVGALRPRLRPHRDGGSRGGPAGPRRRAFRRLRRLGRPRRRRAA